VVQQPEDALFGGMPQQAILAAAPDYILSAGEIGPLLARLVMEEIPGTEKTMVQDASRVQDKARETVERDLVEQAANQRSGELATYSCPECGGTLWQIDQERLQQFHCHVGHVYSTTNLLIDKSEELEHALWASARLFTEKATLTRQIAARARELGDAEAAERIETYARLDDEYGQLLREALLERMPNPTSQAVLVAEALNEAADRRTQEDGREG